MAETAVLGRMKDHGLRVTAQRRAIAAVFEGRDVHLTVEAVHRRASAALPELSLATVYNALSAMVATGLLTEHHHLSGPTRYDPAPQPHHHLVCRQCGQIVDVDAATVGPRSDLDGRARERR